MQADLKSSIRSLSSALGFDLVGFARATSADQFGRFEAWLDRGYHGEMDYLARHREARRHPESILAEVKTVIMLGTNYRSDSDRIPPQANTGRVAAYAHGPDYHRLLWKKLDQLLLQIQAIVPEIRGRGVVDTAPLLERDFARRAGLGWIGKNTMLINRKQGSFLFLAALLLDIELEPDPVHQTNHCGSCTRCLSICPTQAFVGPGWLDARKCISYLTIELRSTVPESLREPIGEWLFGCDLCQTVCPWNRKAEGRSIGFPHDESLERLDLLELLQLDETQFRERFRGTAILRTKRTGLLRNALIVLGNQGTSECIAAIQLFQRRETDPTLIETANWALHRLGNRFSTDPA